MATPKDNSVIEAVLREEIWMGGANGYPQYKGLICVGGVKLTLYVKLDSYVSQQSAKLDILAADGRSWVPLISRAGQLVKTDKKLNYKKTEIVAADFMADINSLMAEYYLIAGIDSKDVVYLAD